ncbi:MAG: hypothetical protein ACRD0K_00320 [Egibacteraceae bacterium]
MSGSLRDRAPAPGRAPRLRADERIAPYITRLGRFRRIDPAKSRPLPKFSQVLGALAWAALLGGSFRRALRAERPRGGRA